jgi:Pyruvate/2-oxoacid:ferredoxin oxidoreductase gamma subunit
VKKVVISGEGGQGVRVISHTLATLLANLGYEVSLLYDYDSAVRGAMSVAHLIYGKEPIANPVVDQADILLKLSSKGNGFRAEKTVCDIGLCTDEEIPFSELGVEKFGKEIFGNMIALGRLITLVGIEVSDEEMAKVLPLKYGEENVNAVHFGYHLKEEDLGRGLNSRKVRGVDFSSEQPGTADLEDDGCGRIRPEDVEKGNEGG